LLHELKDRLLNNILKLNYFL